MKRTVQIGLIIKYNTFFHQVILLTDTSSNMYIILFIIHENILQPTYQ